VTAVRTCSVCLCGSSLFPGGINPIAGGQKALTTEDTETTEENTEAVEQPTSNPVPFPCASVLSVVQAFSLAASIRLRAGKKH
jgi:hypothetical protein